MDPATQRQSPKETIFLLVTHIKIMPTRVIWKWIMYHIRTAMDQIMYHQNSYAEVQITNVMVFGDGTFER